LTEKATNPFISQSADPQTAYRKADLGDDAGNDFQEYPRLERSCSNSELSKTKLEQSLVMTNEETKSPSRLDGRETKTVYIYHAGKELLNQHKQ